ncbi:MAG: alpha/beta fold hydrolase [Solirubrobacteraceae bacterium]
MAEITAHSGLLKDTKLHVEDTGGMGRPVVLIHGWPLSGDSWSLQVPALRDAGYRVVTYDRRGFGRSDKPLTGYAYESLTNDLHSVLAELELQDVTLVGFSMGGGEVARYFGMFGDERLHSVVFASSVTPYMLQSGDNPRGPLGVTDAAKWTAALTTNQDAFYDEFTTGFFSVEGVLKVSEEQRQDALSMCRQASKAAALQCMTAWGNTDFREDLPQISVPALVIHGGGDETVPFEGSGKLTHSAIDGSQLHLIAGAPHGCNVSHAEDFNGALLSFLAK